MKTYTWYSWIDDSDKLILNFFTSIDGTQYANGFRFIKEKDGWKFDLSRNWSYNPNPELNKEVDIWKYNFPRYFLHYIMILPFKDTSVFE